MIRTAIFSACIFCFSAAAQAQSLKTPDEAAAAISDQFGVEVLKTERAMRDGRMTYLLTVMEPGSLSNGAFRVSRLRVDAGTGELVSAFDHNTSGYDLPGANSNRPDQDGRTLSGGVIWR